MAWKYMGRRCLSPNTSQITEEKRQLFVLLLMSVFSQTLLTLVRRDLMSFSFLTTGHNLMFFIFYGIDCINLCASMRSSFDLAS